MRNWAFVFGTMVMAALLAGCGGQGRGGDDASEPEAVAIVEDEDSRAGEGGKLYRQACIMCHGARGRGTQLGPSLIDAEWTQAAGGTAQAIAGVVRAGVPQPAAHPIPMPAKGDGTFSDEQVRTVSDYVDSLTR